MATGREEFARQLGDLEIEVDLRADNLRYLVFPMEVEAGRFAGNNVRVGLEIPDDFVRNPPGGPHVSPRLVSSQGGAPGGLTGAVHASPFGVDFEYWSRPYLGWGKDGYSVAAYLAHVRMLFFRA